MKTKRNMLLLLLSTGAVVMILTLAADYIKLGRSAGFGSLQIMGLVAGELLVLGSIALFLQQKLAANPRGATILLLGLSAVVLITTLSVDLIHSDRISSGFGLLQATNLVISAAGVLYGLALLRRKNI